MSFLKDPPPAKQASRRLDKPPSAKQAPRLQDKLSNRWTSPRGRRGHSVRQKRTPGSAFKADVHTFSPDAAMATASAGRGILRTSVKLAMSGAGERGKNNNRALFPRAWDPCRATGCRQIQTPGRHSYGTCTHFSPDGHMPAASTDDRFLRRRAKLQCRCLYKGNK